MPRRVLQGLAGAVGFAVATGGASPSVATPEGLGAEAADVAAEPRPDGAVVVTAPHPDLSPRTVVRAQLMALREAAEDPEAMGVVFAFASPANRRVTGPLPRFDAMVRSPPYGVLVGHRSAEIVAVVDLSEPGDAADEPVAPRTACLLRTVVTAADGGRHVFDWRLERVTPEPGADGEFRGGAAWRTSGV